MCRPQRGRKIGRRREALGGQPRERHFDRVFDVDRNVAPLYRQPGTLPRRRATGVRRMPDQHLVEDAPQTVDVAPAVELRSGRLLRAHVVHRADDDPRAGHARFVRRADRARDAEIAHDGMPRLDEDVLRLDVAMHDVLRMRVRQRVGHIARDLYRVGNGQAAFTLQPVAQRFALDIRHRVEQHPVGDIGVEQRQDVGVRQRGGDRDLAEEPVVTQRLSEIRPQHLEGHPALIAEVTGEIDKRHPATADLALNRVPARQYRG